MQTYYAKSIFVSKVFWINVAAVAIEILQMTELLAIFPPGWGPYRLFAVGVLNILMRRTTERPARFISPGDVEPVQVKSISPS